MGLSTRFSTRSGSEGPRDSDNRTRQDAVATPLPPKRGTTLDWALERAGVRETEPLLTPSVIARRAAMMAATACLHSVATGHVHRETHSGSPLAASPLCVTRHWYGASPLPVTVPMSTRPRSAVASATTLPPMA